MTFTSRPSITRLRRGLVLPLLLLVSWEASSRTGLVDPRFLPPLEAIFSTALTEIRSGDLVRHLAASLARDLLGFAIGASAGAAFGVLLGLSPLAARLFGPTFHALKQIAVLAWIPIISIWFGFAESAKVVFIALAAFVPVVVNTKEGVASASPQLVEVGRALRFSHRQMLLRVFLPSALPSIATGLQLALIYSWLATVGAEYFMAVGPGIGGLIIAGRERFQMDLVMLGVVILGLVGFLLNATAASLAARALRWRTA
ncbi:taurine ABC transporter permease [Methylobacterium indicum]|uniref:ABC transporter permease n=1 Tax=Methylobacterium indicum TaxID=1775910 RepID=UPI000734C3FB|nr:ABC transporter permease [Methylobacterium indicum]KTS37839.1 taurine ABC transporter permease [Methylobacterium indicum]KTS41020.1 taurine ABC transporter permease [Methylobacterium indicum]KTS50703.1 taurine ABC transporter permease [Methylobacterium indicum]